ncbi:hypothetical protein VPA32_orf089 [Klebsiella phage vB_KpnM_VPA32]|uniref:Uncharacterized protein n=2 Tax=Karamvirus pg7 TaxID=1913655 RepID=A0A5B9NFY6_9CAUD|nr:hypothetical protein CG98_gp086 [Enterobacter phage PG7]QEG13127.1 hypothetical protein KAALPHA_90 [Klebsiella phage vB_KaeM_KaAlpha]ULA52594.1 hypothetical protein [Enterobacter phage vB-EclM_KMB20]UVD32467.1 hypothetical protein ENTB43_031 [Enterobacter phage Entb_43]WJJ59054.1 hypothetical protein VPA32_orf089 [Klebsiella phage vB_KpnM_VPA32]AHI60989.1 hypothetical protein PG7_086 [Enterobacter phage PG7]
MNLKDLIIKNYKQRLSDIHCNFIRRMVGAVELYEKQYDRGFELLVKYPTVIDIKGRMAAKSEFIRLKTIGLIEMDRMQIHAQRLFEKEKAINEEAFETQMKATEVSTSVWFSGDPNTPAYH